MSEGRAVTPMTPLPPVGRLAAAVALAIVGAAAALRFWHIDTGIPYNVGQDEPQIMERVVRMMKSGDFNPHFFDWPTLTFYLNLIVAAGGFLAGSMRGAWSHLDQVGAADFYLVGRQFTALVGTATVAVTFAAARRWGTGTALMAAALVAVNSSHVRESHYVLTDVPTTFFVTLTLWLSLRAYERRTMPALLWAAVAAGLAASCKYNGAIAVVMPLSVAVATGGGLAGIASRVSGVVGVMFASFLAGTPYAVLDLPKFLNDYARLAAIFARERGGDSGWSIYVKYLSGAMAWPALALAAAGGVMLVRRALTGPVRVPAIMVVSFATIYFMVMAGSYQIYGRYMLPLYPFLSVMAAIAAVALSGHLARVVKTTRGRHIVAGVVAVALIAMPAAGAIDFGRSLGRTSTIGLAYQWLVEHVPEGASVAVEAGALRLPPQYRTVGVRSLLDRSLDEYRRDGIAYLVAASPTFQAALASPQDGREEYAAYRRMLSQAAESAAFDPSRDVPGPAVRIYNLPK